MWVEPIRQPLLEVSLPESHRPRVTADGRHYHFAVSADSSHSIRHKLEPD
jgi:hypothetical protein